MNTSSSRPPPSPRRRRHRSIVVGAKDAAPVSSGPDALAERMAANTIAGSVGCDFRTALRAIRLGPDAIKPLRLREELRPHVEKFSAERAAARSATEGR